MRTNIILNDSLLNEAMRLTRAKTKKATVDAALRELIASARRRRMLALKGKVKWQGDLSKMRRW